MVNTVKPKAKATPKSPMPTLGKAAASTALPQPPRTSHMVPKNSAPSRLAIDIRASLLLKKFSDLFLVPPSRRGEKQGQDNVHPLGCSRGMTCYEDDAFTHPR